jgi:hypothetical protein
VVRPYSDTGEWEEGCTGLELHLREAVHEPLTLIYTGDSRVNIVAVRQHAGLILLLPSIFGH